MYLGNPSDVKWLQTALHKGTSRDRANAGGLLVQSNPLANLETLESLISFTKITNKNSTDSVGKCHEKKNLKKFRILIFFTLFKFSCRCSNRFIYQCTFAARSKIGVIFTARCRLEGT